MKILGLPLSKERCTICMEAKGTRCSFSPTPIPRTKKIGELIYCDIGGPITPTSKDGEKYYLTIIDYDENGESKTLTSKEPPSTSKELEIEPSSSSKI
ncbi:unnamed protein product, partial [Brenthis ino]